jgi:hypothetical protein
VGLTGGQSLLFALRALMRQRIAQQLAGEGAIIGLDAGIPLIQPCLDLSWLHATRVNAGGPAGAACGAPL